MNGPNRQVKQALSAKAQEWFEDVATQRVLGATAHIKLISDMFLDLCNRADTMTGAELTDGIMGVAEYFISTRGEASQAITNAIRLMLGKIDNYREGTGMQAAEYLRGSIAGYLQQSAGNLQKIKEYTGKVIAKMNAVMLFDYSSTVNYIADIAHSQNQVLKVLVPQSIALDGGKPYIKPFREAGHKVHFIPDGSLYYYIQQCQAAFIGSETFYPNGDCFNTVGAEMLAFLCTHFEVPFYVITPLIKLDRRAQYGYQKPPIMINNKARMARGLEEDMIDGVDFTCPELVRIPARDITAYITEKGIIPPGGIYAESLNFI